MQRTITDAQEDRADLADLAVLARTFFVTEAVPRREEFADVGYTDRRHYPRAGELGLLCMSIPEHYGSGGGAFAHETVLFAEQVKAGDSTLQLGVHAGIVPHYVLAYASEENSFVGCPSLRRGSRSEPSR